MYSCVVCGAQLFSSHDKFESGCGWPAFSQVLSTAAVNLVPDYSHGMSVICLAGVFHSVHHYGNDCDWSAELKQMQFLHAKKRKVWSVVSIIVLY